MYLLTTFLFTLFTSYLAMYVAPFISVVVANYRRHLKAPSCALQEETQQQRVTLSACLELRVFLSVQIANLSFILDHSSCALYRVLVLHKHSWVSPPFTDSLTNLSAIYTLLRSAS